MKKTFLYVMMAAMALFTCTMTSCSDDDDAKNNTTEEAMIDDINQCILNNFVVLNDDYVPVRGGMYGGFKDAADSTSFICLVDDAEAAVTFYNNLMPDSLVGKVKVDGQKRTLSYTQEGKQYTMTYAPASGENIATITLPNVEGYNKYARTVQLRDHVSDNAMTPLEFVYEYPVGKAFKLNNAHLLVQSAHETAIYEYNTRAEEGYSPDYYCMYNDGRTALFVYFPHFSVDYNDREDYLTWYAQGGGSTSKDDDLYDYLDNELLVKRQAPSTFSRVYPINWLTTNQCYVRMKDGGYNEYLPTMQEVKAIFNINNLNKFINGYNKINDKYLSIITSRLLLESTEAFLQALAPGYTAESITNFATCETKNSLFSTKKVHAFDIVDGENWVDKNSVNKLLVMYVRIKLNK